MTTIVLNDEGKRSSHGSMSIVFLLTQKKYTGYLEADFTLRQCIEKMRYHGYTAMPLLSKEGLYLGTVTEGDLLWYLVDQDGLKQQDFEHIRLRDIYRKGWNPPVTINESLEDVLQRLLNQNFVPVVDDRNVYMGIITRKSALQYYLK